MELTSLNNIVRKNHPYRKFIKALNFDVASTPLKDLSNEGNVGGEGYGLKVLLKCLVIQHMENLSDRELERYLAENTAAKWFCGFTLNEVTPDHSLFTRVRAKIGTKRLSTIFNLLKNQLKSQGLMSEVFTFVDATHLIAKANLWEERDTAIKQKIDKLGNETLSLVAKDKDAKIGCKGKKKYWYGYKQHVSVDMQSGLINKVAITPANTTDSAGLKHVCPKSGAVFGDKGYSGNTARKIILRNGCHDATIKKNNMKIKNRDLDKWRSKMRSPYERVFNQRNPRVRFKGLVKNQFAAFMNAICFNLKRTCVLLECLS